MSSSAKLSITDLSLQGRLLFLRVDFNVPLQEGRVSEDTRIRAALPTIRLVRESGARVVVASHLGRPGGERRPALSLRPVAQHLGGLLGQEVLFAPDCVGAEVEGQVSSLEDGQLLVLENLRFHPGETSNDADFARCLGGWAQEYVNDAFGTAHRAHASTVGIPGRLGRGAAGLLMDRELDYLSRVVHQPQAPVVAVLGGAKVSDKIEVIRNLLTFVDCILIGGGMAFTFLRAQGREVGSSLLEEQKIAVAAELLDAARVAGVQIRLPADVVISPRMEAEALTQVVAAERIPEGWMGLDIGPETVEAFSQEIAGARTLVWNGPLGVFEMDQFAAGTLAIALAVAASEALTVVGGGDSLAAVAKSGVQDRISHLSTGGGASLEFLAGKVLPGVEILTDR